MRLDHAAARPSRHLNEPVCFSSVEVRGFPSSNKMFIHESKHRGRPAAPYCYRETTVIEHPRREDMKGLSATRQAYYIFRAKVSKTCRSASHDVAIIDSWSTMLFPYVHANTTKARDDACHPCYIDCAAKPHPEWLLLSSTAAISLLLVIPNRFS